MPNEPVRVAGSDSLLPHDDQARCTRDLVWRDLSEGGEAGDPPSESGAASSVGG